MDQLLTDKGLEFKIADEHKSKKRFSFAIAKEKVVRLLDPVLGLDHLEDVEQKAPSSSTKGNSKRPISPEVAELVATFAVNARILKENGEYPLAINLYREILTLNPFATDSARQMMMCLIAIKSYDEAERCCRNLLNINEESSLQKTLADILYRKGVDEEARRFYFDALSDVHQDATELFEIYKNLGNIAVRVADFDEAEEFYNKAYTLNPRSDVLLVNYGTLAVQQSDYEKASERFVQALDVNAHNDKAWVGLALINEHKGDFELAWANLNRALDSNPRNQTALNLLCRWSFRNECFDQPIAALQNFLADEQFDERFSLILAKLLLVVDKPMLAKLELERLLLWNPGNEEAIELFAQVRKRTKNA